MTFYVIGIGNKAPNFSEKQVTLFQETKVFSGGKRHLELVQEFLPANYKWLFIKSPMETLFQQYEEVTSPIVVFASGNPLFYGFTNTLKNKYPKATIHTEPYFSAITILAHKTNTTINNLQTISVHGRTWKALDIALLQQLPLIGVLTDTSKNPAEIAKRLLQYGYTNYKITIGEDLEGAKEKIQELSLTEAVTKTYHALNCVLLHKAESKNIPFGIKDKDFVGLRNRPKMITKMPIRLVSLHLLDVVNATVLWDIGFCTGSISIEAKLKNPTLEVVAFEKREECREILEKNQCNFGVPDITSVIGDFFEQDIHNYAKPSHVFIGGHGGKLKEMLLLLDTCVLSGTQIVINAVKESSSNSFVATAKNLGWLVVEDMKLTVDLHNPIRLLKAIKQ